MLQIVEDTKKNITTLSLSGRMDFGGRSVFLKAIDQAKGSNPQKIALNLSGVPFIDSAGLGLFMLAHKNLEEANIRLSLEVPEGYVKDVLTLTNMGAKIPVVTIAAAHPSQTVPSPMKKVRPTEPAPPKAPLKFDSPDMQELLLPILEKLGKKDLDLPPLTHVAQQVLALTTDPHATPDRLLSLIQEDPVLTAKIFQIANSPASGTAREIDSLSQAIVWLGLNSVSGLAFALSLQSGVFLDRGYEKEVRTLWAHAMATASYAKVLASVIRKDTEAAFLSGLLHSLGKLFVIHTVNQSRSSTDRPLPWAMMLILIEQSYIEVGRQLADAWNFPVPVKEAINLHQHFSYHLAVHPSKSAAITCLARHLATYQLDSVSVSEDMLRALPVTASLNIPPDFMDGILAMKDLIHTRINSFHI